MADILPDVQQPLQARRPGVVQDNVNPKQDWLDLGSRKGRKESEKLNKHSLTETYIERERETYRERERERQREHL